MATADIGLELNQASYKADCCVVGGGPGGLLLSLLLSRRGRRVVVLEKENQFPILKSGAVLHPYTLKQLDHINLLGPIKKGAQELYGFEEFGPQGCIFSKYYASLEDCPVPYALSVSMEMLRNVFLEFVKKEQLITIITGVAIKNITRQECSVVVDMSFEGAESQINSNVLIGCDGKNSFVRKLAGIKAEFREFKHCHLITQIDRPEDWSPIIRAYHANGQYVFTIPTMSNKLNIFLTMPVERGVTENDFTSYFNDGVARCVPALIPHLSSSLINNNFQKVSYKTLNASSWREGNILLMGDSAHAMHSFGGQGLNTTIDDAFVLSNIIDRAISENDYSLLDLYEINRKSFIDDFQNMQHHVMDEKIFDSSENSISRYENIFTLMTLGQQNRYGGLQSIYSYA